MFHSLKRFTILDMYKYIYLECVNENLFIHETKEKVCPRNKYFPLCCQKYYVTQSIKILLLYINHVFIRAWKRMHVHSIFIYAYTCELLSLRTCRSDGRQLFEESMVQKLWFEIQADNDKSFCRVLHIEQFTRVTHNKHTSVLHDDSSDVCMACRKKSIVQNSHGEKSYSIKHVSRHIFCSKMENFNKSI